MCSMYVLSEPLPRSTRCWGVWQSSMLYYDIRRVLAVAVVDAGLGQSSVLD